MNATARLTGLAKPITIERNDTILTITVQREYSEAEQRAHLSELHEIMEEGKATQIYRWVVINDIRVPVFGTPMNRRIQAEWMVAHDEEMRNRTSGIAFVMSSALLRTTLTAVLWLAPLPVPHAIFSDLNGAMGWARERDRERISPLARPARARNV